MIATTIDGRPVGREPTLAISPHGLRLAVFRTDINLDDGHGGNGTLYASRSPDGVHWYHRADRRQRLRRHAGIRRAGPARHRLPRARRHDERSRGAPARTTTTAPGTSRRSRTRPSGRRRARPTPPASGSRSTATWRSRSPTSIPAATRCGSSARTPVRSASAPCPASAARAALAFGANGEVGVVCAGLAGEDARLWVATGRLGGATRTFPAMGQSVSSAVIAGFSRGAPIVAFRDRRGAFVAVPGIRRYHSSLIARASRYSAEQPVQRGLRRGALERRATSASRWSRTARCSCSPKPLSSPRPGRARAKGVAWWVCDACLPPSPSSPSCCSRRPAGALAAAGRRPRASRRPGACSRRPAPHGDVQPHRRCRRRPPTPCFDRPVRAVRAREWLPATSIVTRRSIDLSRWPTTDFGCLRIKSPAELSTPGTS